MPLPDFTTVCPPLAFAIGGKVYETYGPSVGDWQLMQRIEAGTASAEETEGADLYRMAVGDAYEAMVADNVPWTAYRNAALACAAWTRSGSRDLAEAIFRYGPDQAKVAEHLAAAAQPAPVKAKAPRAKRAAS